VAVTKTIYVCSDCQAEFAKWQGQCLQCKKWNSLEEVNVSAKTKKNTSQKLDPQQTLETASVTQDSSIDVLTQRTYSQFTEFDRVLGGGFVAGSLILLGGEPGIGKSTLLLQVAQNFPGKIAYVSGEESKEQILSRMKRLNCEPKNLTLIQENSIDKIINWAGKNKPKLLLIDSIQSVHSDDSNAFTGSVSQIRESTQRIMEYCKKNSCIGIVTGHVTKDGQIAGPKLLEHAVDVVLYFELQRGFEGNRILRAQKNRFGSTGELAIFEMTAKGLISRSLSEIGELIMQSGGCGSLISLQKEGTQMLPLEIQALVTTTGYANGRRIGEGIEIAKIHMAAAILEKYLGYKMSQCDIYVRIYGNNYLKDSSCDLALITAMASSYREIDLPLGTMVLGEVSLTGNIRTPSFLAERLKAISQFKPKSIALGISHSNSNLGQEKEGLHSYADGLNLNKIFSLKDLENGLLK